MTLSLILLITVHVFLALAAAVFFYGLLLKLLSKKGASRKSLIVYALLGFVTSGLAWFTGGVSLSDYYKGLFGFVTGESVTALMPLFAGARSLLFPILMLVALVVLITVWFKGGEVNENSKVKAVLVMLVATAAMMATVLSFLGVLVP